MNVQKTLGITLGMLVLLGTASFANADTGIRLHGLSSIGLGDRGWHKGHEEKRDEKRDTQSVSGEVTAKTDTTLTITGKDNTVYTVQTTDAKFKTGSLADISIGDRIRAWGDIDGATVKASHIFEVSLEKMKKAKDRLSHVALGVVTSVNGSVFTIDPVKRNGTTTVTTDANTTFTVNGQATTSSALGVGSKVLLFGTTTATSTSGSSFSASMVNIFANGFLHLKHWFSLR